ncbi:DgyrCDS14821 [Dimorphilus gyrociliatus]|uniref:DgyrCDS14821 n=1 Tax=Dimorphilus gyrociliatus TaxID=2664684 RepID=A0A7I8WF20_9ANNE|nr:DgyrCDS14821 [Dimorphilus gyrociliatus]
MSDSRSNGFSGECHPEIFTVPPKDAKEQGPLSKEQVDFFFREGYLVIEDFFDIENDINPCLKAMDCIVENCASILYKAGKITNKHEDKGSHERLTYLAKEYPDAPVIAYKFGGFPIEFRNLWSNERLLDALEQLLGPDIQGHPNYLFRTKIPNNQANDPWHQDSAYLDMEACKVLQITGWIPFIDVNETNSCMKVVKRKKSEIERTLGADMEKDVVLCEMRKGSILLFNNMLPHTSTNNLSNEIRWSMDVRWQSSKEKLGFCNKKPGILMRDSQNPLHKINWSEFDTIKPSNVELFGLTDDENDFGSIITGPYMKNWNMTNKNRHVLEFFAKESRNF